MPHVGASISESTKADWEEYLEESPYGNMSELIRAAVRKEIRREGNESDGVPRELEQELTRVSETQQSLENQMAELLEGFDAVEEAATLKTYPEEIKALGHRIGEHLEEIPRDEFEEGREQTRNELLELGREVSDTDDEHPYSPGEIEEALNYLEENLSYIKVLPQGPSDFYRIRG